MKMEKNVGKASVNQILFVLFAFVNVKQTSIHIMEKVKNSSL